MNPTREMPVRSGEATVLAFLKRLFRRAGWQVLPAKGTDLLIKQQGKLYAIELKAVRVARRSQMIADLADAYLRARVASRELGASPFPIIAAPSISKGMARSLSAYADKYLDGSAWGLIDGKGRLDFHRGPALSFPPLEEPPKALVRPRPPEHLDLFSDLGQWMFKILLGKKLSPAMLSAPQRLIRSTADLAESANVSRPHATRFLRHLWTQSFLRETSTSLKIVRVDELLTLWAAAYRKPARDIPAKWLLPEGDSAAQLHRALARHAQLHLRPRSSEAKEAEPTSSIKVWTPGHRACLGLFAAADRLGVGLVSGAVPHLYLEESSPDLLASLGLTMAAPGEGADLWIRIPRFPESCFRGAVVIDGVPTSDVLQCWLDVRSHLARGSEQADFIFRRVLKPALLRS